MKKVVHKKYAFRRLIATFGLAVMLAGIPVNIVSAQINNLDLGANEIYYYDPRAKNCDSSTSGPGTSQLEGFTLPASKGKTGNEEPIDEQGRVPSTGGRVTFSGFASLGQEFRDYYITMRWNYVAWNWNGTSVDQDVPQVKWMRDAPRKVLVTNPRNGKSIIAVAMEAGPAPWTGVDKQPSNTPKQGWVNPTRGTPADYTGRVSGFPPPAITALDAKQGMTDGSGDVLFYSWAPDQTAKPGPTTVANAPGTNTTACTAGGDISGADVIKGPSGTIPTVFYSQGDDRWRTLKFGDCGTVGACGCGSTSFAMVAATINKDSKITPQTTVELWNNKHWSTAGGTAWAAMHDAPKEFGFKSETIAEYGGGGSTHLNSSDLKKIADAVRGGKLVIASGKGTSGLFTTGGHLIVIRGVTEDGKFLVNDPKDNPTTKVSTNKAWDASVFLSESYAAWAFYK